MVRGEAGPFAGGAPGVMAALRHTMHVDHVNQMFVEESKLL